VEHLLRLWFLAFYAVGILVFLVKVIPASLVVPPTARRAHGAARFLPAVLVLWDFLVPPALILTHAGELDVHWLPLRALGFLLSLYAAVMLLWGSATLGRFLVPQAVVVADHALVTGGPYRFVRHPVYSGDLALWLGAALGTVNVLLLVLWPGTVAGTWLQTREEEKLLASRFGAAYEGYAKRTGRLVPRLGARAA
jgi:protein-S-isoprenylcysteine O-methyltransferase Ste14